MDFESAKLEMLKLRDKYPEILERLGGEPNKTCMSWEHGGIAVGRGWWGILDAAMSRIQNHINHVNEAIQKKYNWAEGKSPVSQVVFEQVKEKFGELRIYHDGGDDYVDGVISMAVAMSARTCEKCGNPGKMRRGGWIRCLCDTCEENLR